MKLGVHPAYHQNAQVTCACGNAFTVGSTKPVIKVDLCSKCHPFYTGVQKFVDRVGKIERFQAKQAAAAQVAQVKVAKKQKRQEEESAPKTLREMLMAAKSA
jgi:large subunit ribosomal protein L31